MADNTIPPRGLADDAPVNHYPEPRPEPVLDAQQLTRAVLGLLGAVSALLALFGVTLDVDDDVTQAIGAVVGLGVLVAGVVLPRLRAKKARALVTPVSSPVSANGIPLVELPGPAATGGPVQS